MCVAKCLSRVETLHHSGPSTSNVPRSSYSLTSRQSMEKMKNKNIGSFWSASMSVSGTNDPKICYIRRRIRGPLLPQREHLNVFMDQYNQPGCTEIGMDCSRPRDGYQTRSEMQSVLETEL